MWGTGECGQLGMGNNNQIQYLPLRVLDGKFVVTVELGPRHSSAIDG